jgi:hypothetical protein
MIRGVEVSCISTFSFGSEKDESEEELEDEDPKEVSSAPGARGPRN